MQADKHGYLEKMVTALGDRVSILDAAIAALEKVVKIQDAAMTLILAELQGISGVNSLTCVTG